MDKLILFDFFICWFLHWLISDYDQIRWVSTIVDSSYIVYFSNYRTNIANLMITLKNMVISNKYKIITTKKYKRNLTIHIKKRYISTFEIISYINITQDGSIMLLILNSLIYRKLKNIDLVIRQNAIIQLCDFLITVSGVYSIYSNKLKFAFM